MSADEFKDRAELDQWLAERNLVGLWSVPREREVLEPGFWKWADVHRGLVSSPRLVTVEMAGMRTLELRNPSLKMGTSKTINFYIQCLMPGERTRAHRALGSETRFVLKASPGATFIVEGEPFPMEEGDLITTPSWAWHDHYNGSEEPAYWIDGMEQQLVGIGASIGDQHPSGQQVVTKPEGFSARTLGHAKASWLHSDLPTPAFRYPWKDTFATLQMLQETEAEGDAYDGIHLIYSHPLNGGPTLPTRCCAIQLLKPQQRTKSHRHNSTTLYHAFRGRGAIVLEDRTFEWAQGDSFMVPPWAWHKHENRSTEDAILFSISDWPSMSALGIYREETAD